jgi:hypothetical protein
MKATFAMLVMLLCVGCAATPERNAAEPYQPKEYHTGSNVPRSPGSEVKSTDAETAARELQMRTQLPPKAP